MPFHTLRNDLLKIRETVLGEDVMHESVKSVGLRRLLKHDVVAIETMQHGLVA